MRSYDPGKIGCYAGWRRYEGNPVIDERIGEVSDAVVLEENGKYKMYYSHRFLKKILLAAGENGLDFRPYAEGAVTDEDVDTKAYIVGDHFYAEMCIRDRITAMPTDFLSGMNLKSGQALR